VAKAKGKPTELETSELRQASYLAVRQLQKRRRRRQRRSTDFLISDLEHMRGRGGTALTTGIKGSGLGDLKVFAQRWLASKKKANHPLLAGTRMCDEVHEILGLPSPPQLTSI
jgi:hypothetical protein